MILKWIFDRLVSLIGLLILWPVLLIVAIMIKVKMPGGPVLFVQPRVGKGGKLFSCHKFRTMMPAPKGGWSTVTVAGDNRITPLGAMLRHYKLDELPELFDVLIGTMSFVGPRPDTEGFADKLVGDDRDVLKLLPGITGPATLKYRLEDEMLEAFVAEVRRINAKTSSLERKKKTGKTSSKEDEPNGSVANVCTSEIVSELPSSDAQSSSTVCCTNSSSSEDKIPSLTLKNLSTELPEDIGSMSDQDVADWYNRNVIYPDKVRLNCYYYRHYSFMKDLQMIFATVLGFKVKFAGEVV